MFEFKRFFLRNFQGIGKIKRILIACLDAIFPTKKSYSQHGEDIIIWELLKNKFPDSIYVDVGANHPTRISNTYKLYRNGFHGICIEPNSELIWLHKTFRKKDIQIAIGCDETANLLIFKNYNIPVLSGFGKDSMVKHTDLKLVSQTFLPVLSLDTVIESIGPPLISFLNIDVEGMDFQVLKGATKTLTRSYSVCIEFNNQCEKAKIIEYLLLFNFEVYRELACNLLFINKNLQISKNS